MDPLGRYEGAGQATVTLKAKLTGEDKTYSTTFDFPELDTTNPEIERLWALAQIEQIETKESIGTLPPSESKDAVQALGVAYQLVTDHTSMVLLDDATFARRGLQRSNRARTTPWNVRRRRRGQPSLRRPTAWTQRSRPFPAAAPHVNHGGGSGGGALRPRRGQRPARSIPGHRGPVLPPFPRPATLSPTTPSLESLPALPAAHRPWISPVVYLG